MTILDGVIISREKWNELQQHIERLEAALQEIGSAGGEVIRDLPLSEHIPRVLPDGWEIVRAWRDGNVYKHRTGLKVIVDTADHEDGRDYMHISVSRQDRLPSWDDLKFVKEVFARNRYAYQVLPPAERSINIHPFCLHLWVPLSESLPLPDFTRGGNTI